MRRLLSNARGPIFWAKVIQSSLVCVILVAMLGATRSPYERAGHNLMCACGCGQILLDCNHVGCPDSGRMINELRAQVASGAPDATILNWFTAKYGATILAAPMRAGFDTMAWIMPIAVFLFATIGTFFLVWIWKRRVPEFAPAQSVQTPILPGDAALLDRIRRETE